MEPIVPIIIPAYEPDSRMIDLAHAIVNAGLSHIIIVNDGSDRSYDPIFIETTKILAESDCTLLIHEVNKGKGRALKTAFEYILDHIPSAIGCVTADSDGQHTVDCISKVISSLKVNSQSLILGVRELNQADIPWKSRFGNNLTFKTVKLITGLDVQDTQTGLRGIPKSFMKELLSVKGERFEFEMRMLLESINKYPIIQIPIQTIYDSKENHQTHFNPIKDSIKIYKVLLEKFIRYLISSLSSFVIDILMFSLFHYLLRNMDSIWYITISTVLARIISSVYNYLMNYHFVFKSKKTELSAAIKYFSLVIIQMLCSSFFVTILSILLNGHFDVVSKIIVDCSLFIISYLIQKKYIF